MCLILRRVLPKMPSIYFLLHRYDLLAPGEDDMQLASCLLSSAEVTPLDEDANSMQSASWLPPPARATPPVEDALDLLCFAAVAFY